MRFLGVHYYPARYTQAIDHAAKARSIFTQYNGSKARTNEQDVSLRGMYGEVLARFYVKAKKPSDSVIYSPLVDLEPDSDPDIIVKSTWERIDAKGFFAEQDLITINSQKADSNDYDSYLIVVVDRDNYRFGIWHVKNTEVLGSGWNDSEFPGYEPCRSIKQTDLPFYPFEHKKTPAEAGA